MFVGYMRRYAEAFCVFKKMVQELKSIDYVRASSCRPYQISLRQTIAELDIELTGAGYYRRE